VTDSTFNEPRLALNRIYTRRGDGGETSLVGGQRAAKDSLRIECFGTVDELNAFTGLACQAAISEPSLQPLVRILVRVQHELFNLGSILATLPEDVHPKQAQITEADIRQLELEIDGMNENLPTLRSFVLPGGTVINAQLHVCRTICRRAERLCVTLAREESAPPLGVKYLNRLSDAFFVWSRWTSMQLGVEEVLWKPNAPAASRTEEGDHA
jgi:cob(I)alamin adenosyltransferase